MPPTDVHARCRFLFLHCNDVAAMRAFYVGILGMEEAAFQDTPQFGWLSVRAGAFEMMWFRSPVPLPVATEFADQPGWQGGTLLAPSWAIGVPEARFADVVRALVAAGTRLTSAEPEWRQDSYLAVSALDPMGATVEVFTIPATRPPRD